MHEIQRGGTVGAWLWAVILHAVPAPGHIAANEDDSGDGSIAQFAHHRLELPICAIASQMAKFHGGMILKLIDNAKECRTYFRKVIRMDELEKTPPQQAFRFAAEDSDCGSILGYDHSTTINDGDQIGYAVEEGSKSHFASPQILLGAVQQVCLPFGTDDRIDLTGSERVECILCMGQMQGHGDRIFRTM